MKKHPQNIHRIIVDFGHPAHVHYFRNLITEMESNGHKVLCFARERHPIQELLIHYQIPYISRGSGASTVLGKALYCVKAIIIIYGKAHSFKPTMLLSFGGGYIAIAGFLLRAKCIVLDDTETAYLNRLMGLSFSSCLITPSSFMKNIGKKQVRIPGTFDLAYLHPRAFEPSNSVGEWLKPPDGRPYAIVRFVAWDNHHDIGNRGIEQVNQVNLIGSISKHYKVYVSSEVDMPNEISQYAFKLKPHEMHSAMFFAGIVIGESGTMATEAATMGTYSILFLKNRAYGVIEHLINTGMLEVFDYNESSYERAGRRAIDVLKSDEHLEIRSHKPKALETGIDVTKFLVWFLNHFPSSIDSAKSQLFDWDLFR